MKCEECHKVVCDDCGKTDFTEYWNGIYGDYSDRRFLKLKQLQEELLARFNDIVVAVPQDIIAKVKAHEE
jgi:hypothetical protein